jgi:putative hydrolase of the HAD superfamily
MKIKAIAFDIDDTLYPDSSLYLPSLGLLWHNWSFLRIYSQVRKKLRVMDYPAPTDEKGFYRVEAQVFKEISGSLESVDEIQAKIRKFYEDWLVVFQKVKPFPKMRETLFSLSKKGFSLGFMSDLDIGNRLEILGVAELSQLAFSSQEAGYLKPNKAPFERLIGGFALAPQEILYVGNSYNYDILGARACGIRTAHITRRQIKGSLADFTFERYAELEAYVDSL